MVKAKTVADAGKEIWLLRVPSSVVLEGLDGVTIARAAGADGEVVGRARGGAREHGGAVGAALGGDLVVREDATVGDDLRPLVKAGAGVFRGAARPVDRVLSLAVEPETVTMDIAKHPPRYVTEAVESVFSEPLAGEEYLGKDFYERTGYADDIRTRAAYRGMRQPEGQRCRFFPNATREPPNGTAPGVVAPSTERKRKKRDGDSAKKSAKKSSKKKKRDSDAADGSERKKKKKKKDDKKSM